MSKKLFHGSCHCQKITYKVAIDLESFTNKCNCTFCRKNSFWSAKVPLIDFEIITEDETKKVYSNDPQTGHYIFCNHCGTMVYGYSSKTDWGPECFSIRIHTLDDISIQEMNNMPVTYFDGKSDTWEEITDPEIIRTLY